ncbi:putative lipoyltransferase 2 [Blattella germanica]|nr:putative lipoyltransferase 2 [Blattella germanica]
MASEGGDRKRILPAWMNKYCDPSERDDVKSEPESEAPYLKFNGKVNYIIDVAACDKACEILMKEAETQKEEIVFGFDTEWPVDYRGSGKTALIQICPEEQSCYLFHVQKANNCVPRLYDFPRRMCRIARILQVGRMSYGSALRLQKLIADNHHAAKDGIHDTLILVEHTPVYTIGIRSKDYSQETEEKLISLGAEFYRTNRGGLITFHGPGQLVAYPILNLKNYKPSVRWYVSKIEETVIDVCKELGIEAETSPHTGVWVGDSKICAIGLRASRFVTSHGLALNCNTDLEWFSHIVPCGIEGKDVTSLSKELNREFTIEDAVPVFLHSFSKLFDCSLCNFPEEEVDKLLANISQQ